MAVPPAPSPPQVAAPAPPPGIAMPPPGVPAPPAHSAGASAAPVVSDQNPAATAAPEFQVVGFTLRGTQAWHRIRIEDLDVVVTGANRRLLPLLRLLKAFRIPKTEEADTITFQAEGAPRTVLSLGGSRIRIGENEVPVEAVVAVSDVTLQRDVYLPYEVLAEALAVQLEWNEPEYAFLARTSRKLKLWDLGRIGMDQVTAAEETLPEVFPTAYPSGTGLHFMELNFYAQSTVLEDRRTWPHASIQDLQQTFWGTLGGGRYKLELSEPPLIWEHGHLQEIEDSYLMADWAEWTYRFPNAEVALGDSTFGLSDLVFPTVQMTGVRVNGLLGATEELPPDGPSPGLQSYFAQPYDFEGYARAGSQVRLLINDRVVEQMEVVADSPTRPGMGAYRFEDVRLSPGVLNDVTLLIVDPDGVETQIRKTIVPTSVLLPKGRVVYLGAVGTLRGVNRWETFGTFAAGRAMYGVTDRLTLGATMADQQGHYEILRDDAMTVDKREYPHRSTHLGAEAAWKATEMLVLSAAAAAATHDDTGANSDDSALKLQVDLYPVRNLQLGARFFRYGPEFFNGQNIDLFDRQGYALYGNWRPHRQWTLDGALGRVRNNLRGDLEETLAVDFQHLEVGSLVIPRTKLSVAVDRVVPSSTGEPQTLWTVRGRSNLPWDLTLFGDVSTGDFLLPEEDSEYFSGLALPGLSIYQAPSASAVLIKPIGLRQSLAGRYWKSGDRQRGSMVHTYRSAGQPSIQIRTEVGMDIYRRDLADEEGLHHAFVENRTEYVLDVMGRNRFGLQTRLECEEWTVLLFASFSNRFAFPDGRPVRISDVRVHPDRGGVQGTVFVDYNANAVRDPGEPGLADVKVAIRQTLTAVTDRRGYFALPGLQAERQVRVSLDLDTIPAVYYPTNGTQMVEVLPRSMTRIDLGVAPASSVAGFVRLVAADGEEKPLVGVRVLLTRKEKDALVADSVTAADGSFYLGNVVAGRYAVSVDTHTLSPGHTLAEPARDFEIPPGPEAQDLHLEPFRVVLTPPPGK